MFLTLEDPNAKIKGSWDPLGAQPIWAAFGRHVVTNLTMQTNSARGFTILLLARYLTERSPLALEAVKRIDVLFGIELEINGETAEHRLAVRREQSAPLIAELEDWMLFGAGVRRRSAR